MKTRLAPAILIASLAGCVSLGSKPATHLLTLSPIATIAAGASRTAGPGETMTVAVPVAQAAIAVARVPVYERGIAVAYVKDAAWVEGPARQFQRLLSETIAARTGKIVLDLRQYVSDPGMRLQGNLSMFGIDGDANEAVVTYDAIVGRPGGRVETRRFTARVPLDPISADTVGPALNDAANTVAAEVADWIKG